MDSILPHNQPVRVQYFLGHWGSWERQHAWLNDQQRTNARLLFRGLQGISKEDMQLLVDKYRPDKGLYLNGRDVQEKDTVLADRYGITVEDYRQRRYEAEHRLAEVIANER